MNKLIRLILGLSIACLLASVAACGPKEQTVQTAAKEINLSAADLGPDWSQMQETGKDQIPGMDQPYLQDANMRMFAADEITGMMIAVVLSTNTVDAARQEMKSDAVKNFGQEFRDQFPDMTLETLPSPNVGDEAVMVKGNLSDLDINLYLMTFRKANVIVMFALIAEDDVATDTLALDYARKAEARIH